jgi:hypothetical protein
MPSVGDFEGWVLDDFGPFLKGWALSSLEMLSRERKPF